jgi:(S)-2-hydroxyglutarate dehydrogenase
MNSCAVIGGGIVGLAVATKLLRAHPGLKVTLLEKEGGVGRHQSTHNSGVLHAGLYYKPGSAKARLAVSGIRQMKAFCQEHNIPHEICGKVVVAISDEEVPRLRALLERGTSNGLQGLAWLTPEQLREREPHAAGKAAVLVPEEGIVDYAAVCEALREEIVRAGGTIRLNFPVERIRRMAENWRLESRDDAVEAEFLINCAGLHCDRVGELAGVPRTTRIVPFRGEYYTIRPERQHLVRHLIYPVPDPGFPFLGVHFTRLIHGGLEAGPNAVLALKREGYSRTSFALRDAVDSLTFPGLWKFAARHARMCAGETARSFSKTLFCRSLQRLVPEIREEDLAPGGSGVRAQAMTSDGILQQDFDVREDRFALHLLNAPSPAATASLAIADDLLARLGTALV